MKRIILISLALVLSALFFAGCANAQRQPLPTADIASEDSSQPAAAQADPLRIMATLFPPYDFARQIAGDLAQIDLLLPPGSESHTYEPTPQDILRIQSCDVFLYIGGESETWVDKVLSSIDTSHMRIVRLIDSVTPVTEEIVDGMEAANHPHEDTHDGDDDHAHTHFAEESAYDEHIWTAPANAISMTQAIAQALIELDPPHADQYRKNTNAYIRQLEELDASFRQIAKEATRNTLVFGDRFPFRYFTDSYGFAYYAAFPGCAEQTEPSAATVAFLIDRVREQSIPVIFYIEFSNERMADTICEATGAKKLLLHSCHSVSKDDMEAGVTYIALMQQNAINLKEAVG